MKKSSIFGIEFKYFGVELWPNLVGLWTYAWTNSRKDTAAAGAGTLHFSDRCLKYAANSSTPASMSGGDDLGLRISEQHGTAICGQRGGNNARRGRNHGVGLGKVAGWLGCADGQGNIRVGLVECDDGRAWAIQFGGDSAAVFQNMVAGVIGAQPAVEAGVDPLGDPAFTREKAMADARQSRQA